MRIAIFSDSALPILNGVSVSIDALIRELRNQGHSVHLFTTAYPRYRDPDPNVYRFRALEMPWSKGYPLAVPPFYRMLLRFRRRQFDVIHTHTPFTIGLVGLRWAESHDLPIVSTYHTLYDRYAHYIPLFPRRYVRYRIAKHTNFYYSRVDRVITPSDAASRWLRRHAVHTPIDVVPTGVARGAPHERAEARMQLGIPPEQRVLLYVGRLAAEKNLDLLFAAAASAFRQDPNLRLWLVGDGSYRAECARIARDLGIGDRVRFVGLVPRADVDLYYAAADLFLFTSLTETQGLVVLEAFNYGVPAVVAAGGGAGEWIRPGENGFLVRADARTLASRVLDVLGDDTLHATLAEGARRTARDQGPERMAELVVESYRRAIESRERTERSAVLV
ncbi:MAG: glycosyltransferase [Fimbriimonas ginsengisoli]|uniref:Glycosyltransferase n=1 Tax=Fimbriimonas ginsengisoli TaxID=1005039 RepID=A0A931LTE5_FIMGI|nr:glycosyltransferase [Fimbriimonas ginsengisoli]